MNIGRPGERGLRNFRHELRTPLNAIIGYSAMLLEDASERDEGRAALATVQEEGKGLLQIVGSLLGQQPGERLLDEGEGALEPETVRVALLKATAGPVERITEACRVLEQLDEGNETFGRDIGKIRQASEQFIGLLRRPLSGDRGPVEPDRVSAPRSAGGAELDDDPGVLERGAGYLLVVDDNETNRDVLGRHLRRQGHRVALVDNGPEALELLHRVDFDLVLLDLLMPGMNGDEVLALMKADADLRDKPVVMISASDELDSVARCIALGADDYLPKPFDPLLLRARIGAGLAKKRLHDQEVEYLRDVEAQVRERTRELEEAQIEIVTRLAIAAEYRDDDTGEHTRRVGRNAAVLARALGWPEDEVSLIYSAARLHDVGKIGVSDNILLKPGKLEPEEYELMRTHTTIGARILSGGHSRILRLAEEIALSHHERWDGRGYPVGLKGEEIPMAARIVAVADVLDALTHRRPYKEAWTVADALAEISRQARRQFDPEVVAACLRVFTAEGGLSPLETAGADLFAFDSRPARRKDWNHPRPVGAGKLEPPRPESDAN